MNLAGVHRPDVSEQSRLCDDLAALWERFAAGGPLCPPGCLCIRGVMIEVTPKEVEGDILAFLGAQFSPGDTSLLAELIARRDLERAWGSRSFGDWIRALPEAGLDADAFALLTESLGRAIESLGPSESATPPRFTCT